ncbi:hypothetical protein [Ruminococcus albus]|uniref:Uncharacterized protein n=1 Tax=Ruminococcus albus TaxID=1264 RepID=A0A1I1K7A3_RUMAL|nr:hypothetical protein [Ruminococcus albus]SFC56152.1 hypothetical protein SAMN02910406_01939 [Ruminococcus albus]
MKIKYKYRSPLFYVLFYGGIVLMILLAYSGVRLREEDAGIILISIAVYIVLLYYTVSCTCEYARPKTIRTYKGIL